MAFQGFGPLSSLGIPPQMGMEQDPYGLGLLGPAPQMPSAPQIQPTMAPNPLNIWSGLGAVLQGPAAAQELGQRSTRVSQQNAQQQQQAKIETARNQFQIQLEDFRSRAIESRQVRMLLRRIMLTPKATGEEPDYNKILTDTVDTFGDGTLKALENNPVLVASLMKRMGLKPNDSNDKAAFFEMAQDALLRWVKNRDERAATAAGKDGGGKSGLPWTGAESISDGLRMIMSGKVDKDEKGNEFIRPLTETEVRDTLVQLQEATRLYNPEMMEGLDESIMRALEIYYADRAAEKQNEPPPTEDKQPTSGQGFTMPKPSKPNEFKEYLFGQDRGPGQPRTFDTNFPGARENVPSGQDLKLVDDVVGSFIESESGYDVFAPQVGNQALMDYLNQKRK